MWSYLLICFSKSPRRFLFKKNIFSLCISQQCTFLASIGSFKSWTTSKRLKMEELGRRGPLSRASWPRWLQMVRNRKRPSAELHPRCLFNGCGVFFFFLSHFIFIFWFGVKSLNQKKLIQSPNPHCAFVWTILNAISSPGWRDGANKRWTQSCKFTAMRIEKW